MDESIRTRMDDTRRKLFEHFDEDVHQRLRFSLPTPKAQLDRVGQRFWSLTRFMLDERARFDDASLAFDLERPPTRRNCDWPLSSDLEVAAGARLDSGDERSRFLYRLSHPLGENVVQNGKALATSPAAIVFDVTNHASRLHVVEAFAGKLVTCTLTRLVIDSYEREEYLLFSGFDDGGTSLDQETMEKLFACAGRVTARPVPESIGNAWMRKPSVTPRQP